MKALSLFAGVGGFDLALERNGAEVVATVENDNRKTNGGSIFDNAIAFAEGTHK